MDTSRWKILSVNWCPVSIVRDMLPRFESECQPHPSRACQNLNDHFTYEVYQDFSNTISFFRSSNSNLLIQFNSTHFPNLQSVSLYICRWRRELLKMKSSVFNWSPAFSSLEDLNWLYILAFIDSVLKFWIADCLKSDLQELRFQCGWKKSENLWISIKFDIWKF